MSDEGQSGLRARDSGPVGEYIAALALPRPAADVEELEATLLERHGDAGLQAARDVMTAGDSEAGVRKRYRLLFSQPALALDVVWGFAGSVTRRALEALEHSGVLDELSAADVVLDVGCGEGLVGAYVAWRTGAQIVGLDLREECRQPVSHLAQMLNIQYETVRGSLLRVPASIKRLGPALTLAFRILHEVDGTGAPVLWGSEKAVAEAAARDPAPTPALATLGAVAGDGAIAVLDRQVSPAFLMRRAIDLAGVGHPIDSQSLQLLRVDGLDGLGWFPFFAARPGATGVTLEQLRGLWSGTLASGPPWSGWSAELMLEQTRASLKIGGLDEFGSCITEIWTAGDRAFVLRAHEEGISLNAAVLDDLPDLEAELRDAADSMGYETWTLPADRPAWAVAPAFKI